MKIIPRELIKHLEWNPGGDKEGEMGEVRVQVRLINAVDEARARQGELSKDKIRQQLTDAVVDTGSVHLVIPPQVMSILGLSARGRRVAEYADGRKEPVDVTEPLVVDINGRDTIEEALVLGDEVLIGQTVLEKLDLLVDCSSRRLVPNPAHPDQPVTKVK